MQNNISTHGQVSHAVQPMMIQSNSRQSVSTGTLFLFLESSITICVASLQKGPHVAKKIK